MRVEAIEIAELMLAELILADVTESVVVFGIGVGEFLYKSLGMLTCESIPVVLTVKRVV